MDDLRIKTSSGWLEGQAENGARSWKGIPYARPPAGERRFAAPERAAAWEGVRPAKAFGPPCLQPGGPAEKYGLSADTPPASEDCLYLNIWAPAKRTKKPLPVMFWIHGGAFVTGTGADSACDGASLARQGVIAVTVNYRLGPFGFLHLAPLGEGFVSNAGLLDQIAALSWIRSEIAAFGGDPAQVTVFGESAGAMSIAAMLAMPDAKGLFARAILQSGAAQTLPAEQAEQVTAGILLLLGIERSDAHLLKELPASTIMQAAEEMGRMLGGGPAMLFQPVVEAATLPVEPLEAIRSGAAGGVALLVGTNRDEGEYFIRPGSAPVPLEGAIRGVELMTDIADAASLVRSYPHTAQGQADIMTDLFFWRAALRLAHAQTGHAPVWMYRFDWTSAVHPSLARAVHMREIVFVFGNLQVLERQLGATLGPDARRLTLEMQAAWLAFAKTGSPDTAKLAWPPYGEPERMTMIFGAAEVPEAVSDPAAGKRAMLGL
ncbi:carboxylesterase/lipase family protein [Cohnella sp. GCM10020058]|uniref:carboxylesterase/lipase family protein n=1 Tax=Cohnella sp. GCM10020058 TaxID=3317330 RepID=UPI0036320FB9